MTKINTLKMCLENSGMTDDIKNGPASSYYCFLLIDAKVMFPKESFESLIRCDSALKNFKNQITVDSCNTKTGHNIMIGVKK